MTILSALLGQPRNTVESPLVPLTSTTLVDWLGGPTVKAGVTVSETSSIGVPAVWRSVNLIAGTIAALPLHAYKEEGEARIRQTSGAAADLLDSPHPDMTPFELWELGVGSLLLWGNAYFLKLYNASGRLAELWWVAPSRVRVGRASDGAKVYVLDGDEANPKSDRGILHIPGFGYDGVCGVSPIRVAKQGIGLALAAEEYGARLFGSGSLATGILQTEQRIDQAQADDLKQRWKAGGTGSRLRARHPCARVGSEVAATDHPAGRCAVCRVAEVSDRRSRSDLRDPTAHARRNGKVDIVGDGDRATKHRLGRLHPEPVAYPDRATAD